MMVWRDGWLSRVQRAARIAAATVAVATIGACGGGQQVSKFQPGRLLAFGDETSIIESDGTKYTVNFVSSATATPPSTLDCTQNQIWVQAVASAYGVPFPQCRGAATTAPSRILATVNAQVADVGTQIDNFLLTDSFRNDDLVTIMAGANDVNALYQRTVTGGLSIEQAALLAEQAGTNLANAVNRVAEAGAKVLIATIPDQSFTPTNRVDGTAPVTFHCPESDGRADTTKADALHCISQRFNAKLRTGLNNDGHKIGLVLFDESVQSIVNSGAYNTTDKACNDATSATLAALRTCTSNTLRVLADGTTTASTATYLWADGQHIAPLGQTTLGSLAYSRASNNPF
jgi:outer membrane lipase/esterase